MHKDQPGVVLRFQAKPGKGDELFDLVTRLHDDGDPDGPVDWSLSRPTDDPDTMWAFEFYRDQESFDRHYADSSLDDGHEQIFALLADEEDGADSSVRADVHIVSSS